VATAVELGDDGDSDEIHETIDEKRRYVRHSRIERTSAAVKKTKKVHGPICQGCGFDFAGFYGERGDARRADCHWRGKLMLRHSRPMPNCPPEMDGATLP